MIVGFLFVSLSASNYLFPARSCLLSKFTDRKAYTKGKACTRSQPTRKNIKLGTKLKTKQIANVSNNDKMQAVTTQTTNLILSS